MSTCQKRYSATLYYEAICVGKLIILLLVQGTPLRILTCDFVYRFLDRIKFIPTIVGGGEAESPQGKMT